MRPPRQRLEPECEPAGVRSNLAAFLKPSGSQSRQTHPQAKHLFGAYYERGMTARLQEHLGLERTGCQRRLGSHMESKRLDGGGFDSTIVLSR